jgi:hypothetical protein
MEFANLRFLILCHRNTQNFTEKILFGVFPSSLPQKHTEFHRKNPFRCVSVWFGGESDIVKTITNRKLKIANPPSFVFRPLSFVTRQCT